VYYLGYLSAVFADAEEVSRCYSVKSESYCYYTDGSMLSWDQAIELCDSKNATLPIITDDDVDNVLQQFLVSDSNSVIRDRPFWIGAHARPTNNLDWHWINETNSRILN